MCRPCSIGGDARDAYAVNEHTHVVGVGDTADGDEHAFVLTPIPEPSMLALVELGALGLPFSVGLRRMKLVRRRR